MNPIESYLDNIFLGLPKTAEVAQARRRIQESMEEKYDTLRSQGRSESEALGTVVAEFGSVSELLGELGQPIEDAAPAPVRNTFPEEEYRRFQRRFGIAIATGVCLCILGVILGGTADSLGLGNWVPALFFTPIAIGVFLFIYFGVQEERYDELKKVFRWGGHQGAVYDDRDGSYKGKNRVAEAVNSMIMMLATVVFLVAGLVYGLWHPAWVVFPVGGILCGMVSILGGVWGDGRGPEPDRRADRESPVIEAVNGVIMLLMVVVFLVIGVNTGIWHPTWVVFPIGGIFCGMVSIIGGIWRR